MAEEGSRTRVVVAPDKFKGSARAVDVAAAIAGGIRDIRRDIEVMELPVADGGDGTIDVILNAGFTPTVVQVPDALGKSTAARFATRGQTAIVELAEAVGLDKLPAGVLAPLDASTAGLGQVIRRALDRVCRRLVICVGGSASTDGGAGMLVALGARVVDPSGCEVPPGGRGLATASRIDVSGLDPRVNDVEITLATDVDNPLLGSRGAAAAFGPQKGADSAAVCFLEESMRSWANLVRATTGRDVAHWAGAGAGGGAGFAALAFLNARVRSGIDVVLESLDFEAKLDGARLVITGEGRLDSQTLGGKAPLGVARACSRWRVPVHAVVGECLLEPARVAAAGFAGCDDLVSRVPNREQAMTDPLPLLTQIGAEIARGPYLATTPARSSTAEKMP